MRPWPTPYCIILSILSFVFTAWHWQMWIVSALGQVVLYDRRSSFKKKKKKKRGGMTTSKTDDTWGE